METNDESCIYVVMKSFVCLKRATIQLYEQLYTRFGVYALKVKVEVECVMYNLFDFKR